LHTEGRAIFKKGKTSIKTHLDDDPHLYAVSRRNVQWRKLSRPRWIKRWKWRGDWGCSCYTVCQEGERANAVRDQGISSVY
jgi:hypothetical protein